MTARKKDNWLERTWNKTKTFILGSVMAISPITSFATTGKASPKNPDKTACAIQVQNTSENSSNVTEVESAVFRAYSGKYYNDVCNGSLCWISSQSETNGCGENGPKKNISSSQLWSSNGLYAGINQMDATQRKAYLLWMKDKPEYQTIYEILKRKNTKSGWAKAAKTNEHLFILSQENYMASQYAPKKFKNLQTRLDKLDLDLDIRTLHPAIIGEMHKMLVQNPGAYTKIANVTKEFLNKHEKDSLNSEAYIKAIAPCVKIGSKDLAKHTIEIMNDSSIAWKEEQYKDALSQVSPKHPADQTWFDKYRQEQQTDFIEARSEEILKKESIIEPNNLIIFNQAKELEIAHNMANRQKRMKIENNKEMYRQQAMNTPKRPKSLQDKRIENAILRAKEHSKA